MQTTNEKSYMPHIVGGAGTAIAIAIGLIMHFEGHSNVAYIDPPGVETICYGHASGVSVGEKATDQQCAQYLKYDLAAADAAVTKIIRVPLTSGQRAAFIDFVYNEGSGTFQKSSIARDMNAGKTAQACKDLLKYTYAGGVPLTGLAKRRQAEYQLCMDGVK